MVVFIRTAEAAHFTLRACGNGSRRGVCEGLALRAKRCSLGSYGVCVFFHQTLYAVIALTAARERGLAA